MKTEQNKTKQKHEPIYFCVQKLVSGEILENDVAGTFACVWANSEEDVRTFVFDNETNFKGTLAMAKKMRELANVIEETVKDVLGEEKFNELKEPMPELQPLPEKEVE